jgi:H+-transporting ATPase
MSSSSGNPQLQATDANDSIKRPGQHDVERGDLHTEKQRYTPNPQELNSSNDENLDDEPDEYTRLLKFIDLEAKKEKRKGDEDGGSDEDQEMRRLWYMPWKKVPVQSAKGGKVPQSWLETDMSQGLSDSEVDNRRARFGYYELERCVEQTLILQRKSLSSLHTVRGSIPFSNLSGTFVVRFFLVRTDFSTLSLHFVDVSLTVMELAVVLAAGLRDWIDFGVIVRSRPRGCLSFHRTRSDRLQFSCSTHLSVGCKRSKRAISSNSSKQASP